jgi:hypothetical protein
MYKINEYNIKYNFFKDFDNSKFLVLLDIRMKYIKDKYKLHKLTDKELLEEYFVEIFSWTVMDKNILDDIKNVIGKYGNSNKTILDPCSGNSFHTFLFNNYLKMNVITIDIQPEENAWIETIEDDGLEFIKKMENHDDKILFLSWIDYTKNELPYNLLTNFKGNMVISVGNYREIDCKKYMDELSKNYKLISEYHCKMPWDDVEEIKIFIKFNKNNTF